MCQDYPQPYYFTSRKIGHYIPSLIEDSAAMDYLLLVQESSLKPSENQYSKLDFLESQYTPQFKL